METRLQPTRGRKRTKNEATWERNIRKISRNKGDEYISASENIVPSKIFEPVESCCIQNCFRKCAIKEQRNFFESFWNLKDYHTQNVFLSTMMKRKDPEKMGGVERQRLISWTYFLLTDEDNIRVCKKFVCSLLNVGKKRLDNVQKKKLANNSFEDLRGKHASHTVKLSGEIKELIRVHCESIPHQTSHYSRESTTLNYFLNPELNLKILYNEFLKYYAAVTQDREIPLHESTYCKYFNHHLNFTFKLPRTDVCNRCYESELQQVESEDIGKHKQEVKDYHSLRKNFISEKKVLCCEFDYAQNLPLPKIPVSDQFYKRLLWLYLFNVHIFSSENSYMFSFLEGSAKKGANTVCSFVEYAIDKEFDETIHEKIVLFSDAAGGQNRNYTVFAFLLALSAKLSVDIWHISPVRGHSYCQCDRNFGLYSQKKKKLERIETSTEYIDLIRNARDPPFTVVKSADKILHDFDETFRKKVKYPKGLKISQAYVIHYSPAGVVQIFENYKLENPSSFKIDTKIKLRGLTKIRPPTVGITKAKMNDVKSLLRYLSAEGKAFFNEYFDSITGHKGVDDSDED